MMVRFETKRLQLKIFHNQCLFVKKIHNTQHEFSPWTGIPKSKEDCTLETNYECPPILLEKFWGYIQNYIHMKMHNQAYRNLEACPWGRNASTSLFMLVQCVHQWNESQFLEVLPSLIKIHLKILCGFKPMWRWSDIIIQIVASLESFTILL